MRFITKIKHSRIPQIPTVNLGTVPDDVVQCSCTPFVGLKQKLPSILTSILQFLFKLWVNKSLRARLGNVQVWISICYLILKLDCTTLKLFKRQTCQPAAQMLVKEVLSGACTTENPNNETKQRARVKPPKRVKLDEITETGETRYPYWELVNKLTKPQVCLPIFSIMRGVLHWCCHQLQLSFVCVR